MRQTVFVIEGLDGSGKATQTKLLCKALADRGIPCRHVTFPDYGSDSSALVKMYLGGDFGSDPGSVNGYAAASFYAVDRYASFQRDWKDDYAKGCVIVADRYVTSNLIYQLSKVPAAEKDSFIDWVEDYEYEKLGLPRPTAVLYLDMDPSISQKLLAGRYQGDESKKDIHERNVAFLKDCRSNALYSAKRSCWNVICCYRGDTPKMVDEIHEEIMAIVGPYLQPCKREEG